MALKPQSPGPTSQPQQARSRKAALPSEQNAAGRAGSAGGIVLGKEKEQAGKAKGAPVAQDKTAAPSTGPNRQRRRPRKLNKEPAPEPSTTSTCIQDVPAGPNPQTVPTELEALKARVRGLEAKVDQLYQGTDPRPDRSPRRRGKGRKISSSTQVPTLSTVQPLRPDDDKEEREAADEELVRLEGELDVARRDLVAYRPRNQPRTKGSPSEDTGDVEEIGRDDKGASESPPDGNRRQVTLSGSYRIPLPTNVSMSDVKTIQSGVSAAQNVARSFLEQRRAAQAAQKPTPPAPAAAWSAPEVADRESVGVEMGGERQGKSWGEWIGGYSMAISRVVKNMEAEAVLENQRAAGAPAMPRRAAGGGVVKAVRPRAKGKLSSELLS